MKDLELRVESVESELELAKEKILWIETHLDEIYRLISQLARLLDRVAGLD